MANKKKKDTHRLKFKYEASPLDGASTHAHPHNNAQTLAMPSFILSNSYMVNVIVFYQTEYGIRDFFFKSSIKPTVATSITIRQNIAVTCAHESVLLGDGQWKKHRTLKKKKIVDPAVRLKNISLARNRDRPNHRDFEVT